MIIIVFVNALSIPAKISTGDPSLSESESHQSDIELVLNVFELFKVYV